MVLLCRVNFFNKNKRIRIVNRRVIISDIILNIIASVIPVFILQFLILPIVASKIDSASYGYLLTIVGLMNLSAATLGNIINNSRLISDRKYKAIKVEGDYPILLGVFFLINILVMSIGLCFYQKPTDVVSFILIILSSIFLLIKGYGQVEFRIKLNFKYIMIDSILQVIGFGIGFVVFLIVGYWEIIYLTGFAFSLLFVFSKTRILKEQMKRTVLMKETTLKTFFLLISGLLLGTSIYVDRLLLYSLLGGMTVSIYYTATILGKTISLVIQPIAGVILSYLAQLDKINNKNIYIILSTSLLTGVIGYCATIFISKPMLTLLYPQYVNESLKYISIATLGIVVSIVNGMINPVVLRFCHSKWQIIINGSYLLFYIILSLYLLNIFGLMGIFIGILIANIIKLIMTLMIYYLLNVNEEAIKNNSVNVI